MEAILGKCPYCDGTGKSIMDSVTGNCVRCNGTGR
jgi:DnaJ-class molecular chaperone